MIKVDASWFGCYIVIIWFLRGKNKSKWFLLFSLSNIFLCYFLGALFSVRFMQIYHGLQALASLRSYALGNHILFTHIAACYISLHKTQTHFEKMKISSNFPPKLCLVNPIFVFYYFEVFKTDFNIFKPFLPFKALQYRFVKLPPLFCVVVHVILRENM